MKSEAILNKLTSKQQQALPLILSGMSSLQVSEKIGVKASTISEWLHHSHAFKEVIFQIRSETIARTTDAIDVLVLKSLEEIAKLISTSKSESIRLKACELVLSKLLQPKFESPPQSPSPNGSINLSLVLKGLGYD